MTETWHDLGREAMQQILKYGLLRLADQPNAQAPAIGREMTELQRLVRAATQQGGPEDLIRLADDGPLCISLLRTPRGSRSHEPSRWWRALREFLRLSVDPQSKAEQLIAAIEQPLFPRRTHDWDEVDRVAGGPIRRSGRRDPRLLFAEDLLAITARAKESKSGERAQRDAAIVSLLCWSPLRVHEIAGLRWEDIIWEKTPEPADFGAWVSCMRRDTILSLPIHRRATASLEYLFAIQKRGVNRTPSGPVFCALRRPYSSLGYRDVKAILDEAREAAGIHATRHDLLAAYGYYLKAIRGCTLVDLREALGYGRAEQVRDLLKTHEAWALNRKADKAGGLFTEEFQPEPTEPKAARQVPMTRIEESA